jgi:hypothetical protein
VVLTTHTLLAPRSGKSRAIPLPPLWLFGPVTGYFYVLIILSPRLKPMTKTPMQVKQCLAQLRKTESHKRIGEIKLLHIDVLYTSTKLKVLNAS